MNQLGDNQLDTGKKRKLPPLPSIQKKSWMKINDPKTGQNYFYNTRTKESRWTDPTERR